MSHDVAEKQKLTDCKLHVVTFVEAFRGLTMTSTDMDCD